MSQVESSNLLKSLLERDPEQVQLWLKPILLKEQDLPENFNWLGLAELSASKATQLAKKSFKSRSLSLDWAAISVSVYQFLTQNNPKNAELYLNSLMNLRMYMILNFEVTENHPILDVNDIIRWVYQDINISPQEALAKSLNWKETLNHNNTETKRIFFEKKLEDIRILRNIKSKFKKLKILVENEKIAPDKITLSWLSVWDKLP